MGRSHVVQMMDDHKIVGIHGTHISMVFEVSVVSGGFRFNVVNFVVILDFVFHVYQGIDAWGLCYYILSLERPFKI